MRSIEHSSNRDRQRVDPLTDGPVRRLPDHLSDGVIDLRRCTLEDRDVTLEAIGESWERLHDWLLWAENEWTAQTYDAFIKECDEGWTSAGEWRYFSFDAVDGSFIGSVHLYTMSGPEIVGIGYWVRTSRTRQGMARRAARLVTSAAFEFLPTIRTVEIQMDAANVASIEVARGLGFHHVARVVKDKKVPASSGIAHVWRIDREEWHHLERAYGVTTSASSESSLLAE